MLERGWGEKKIEKKTEKTRRGRMRARAGSNVLLEHM